MDLAQPGIKIAGRNISKLRWASLVAQTGKESACNVGDPGSITRSGRSPGEGHGISLQYSCLENSIDRGAWWVIVHGIAKSWTELRYQTTTKI